MANFLLFLLFMVPFALISFFIIRLYIKAIKKKIEYNKRKLQHYDEVENQLKQLNNQFNDTAE